MNGGTATHPGQEAQTSPCELLQDLVKEAAELDDSLDDMSRQLRREALETAQEEPHLRMLLLNTVLAPGVRTFEDAVATTVTYRLLLRPCSQQPATTIVSNDNNGSMPPPSFCPYTLRGIIAQALQQNNQQQSPDNETDEPPFTEAGHTLSEAVRHDAKVVLERDPAIDALLEVVLFLKGFAALVCHRVAHYQWHTARKRRNKNSMVALWLQSQASAVFGMDIHPAAVLGAGLLFDHGTGLVIGETAAVGDGCTLLHGVTLGGTGKDSGDRHPKVGRDVLIGANASLLGNIVIGDGAKIGAGSIVLRPIPAHATAVGAPAKIVGRAKEAQPGTTMDETLQNVHQFHKSSSISTLATVTSSDTITDANNPRDDVAKKDTHDYFSDSDEDDLSGVEEEGAETPTTKTTSSSPMTKEASKKDCSCEADVLCPYRQYTRLAALAPPGTITLRTLRQWLEPEGCTSSEIIGGILFALDQRDVGYLKPKELLTPEAQALLVEKTHLSPERVATLVDELVRTTQRRRAQSAPGGAVVPGSSSGVAVKT